MYSRDVTFFEDKTVQDELDVVERKEGKETSEVTEAVNSDSDEEAEVTDRRRSSGDQGGYGTIQSLPTGEV